MLAAGNANKEIAARLGISQRTVENHRAQIRSKTGMRSVADLIRMTIWCATAATDTGGRGVSPSPPPPWFFGGAERETIGATSRRNGITRFRDRQVIAVRTGNAHLTGR